MQIHSPGSCREPQVAPALPAQPVWDAVGLKRLLRGLLHNQQVIVVSNREPYTHQRTGNTVEVTQPPSGLVTALEPVLRACRGTWIAHGSGNADAEHVDAHDICHVPPGVGDYRLRRVWLDTVEQEHYLDGFANQGLWPLCHLANQAPVFRLADWKAYQRVNRRFAQAVVQEACQADPIELVQDYHFALLPAMIRARMPRAIVVSFWHIPWPGPAVLQTCPWQRELLQGMLGSSIIGLQTEVDRRNFLTAVGRTLNRFVDDDGSRVVVNKQASLVRSYPISIQWPHPIKSSAQQQENQKISQAPSVPKNQHRKRIDARWQRPADGKLIVCVDRFDYTKGFLERIRALEHLLLTQPQWAGKLTLLQVAAPTRSAVPAYALFQAQVLAETARVNQRFSQKNGLVDYEPIILLDSQHDHQQIDELYRSADVCLVSSLHDGMNLVAKEFVASRQDEQGVLVLSKFAGAAEELREALLINPHNFEQTANALIRALTMPAPEQALRMRGMRSTVRHANIYRWAACMLQDAAELREGRGSLQSHPIACPTQSIATMHQPQKSRLPQRATV